MCLEEKQRNGTVKALALASERTWSRCGSTRRIVERISSVMIRPHEASGRTVREQMKVRRENLQTL